MAFSLLQSNSCLRYLVRWTGDAMSFCGEFFGRGWHS